MIKKDYTINYEARISTKESYQYLNFNLIHLFHNYEKQIDKILRLQSIFLF